MHRNFFTDTLPRWTGTFILTAATGCQLQADSDYQLSIYYQSPQCGISKPSLELIENQQQWQQLMHNRPRSLGQTEPQTPDFSQQSILLIAAGQKPSAGYQIILNGDRATLVDNALEIDVNIIAPTGMAATIISNPCMLLSLQAKEFSMIRAANMQWSRGSSDLP